MVLTPGIVCLKQTTRTPNLVRAEARIAGGSATHDTRRHISDDVFVQAVRLMCNREPNIGSVTRDC